MKLIHLSIAALFFIVGCTPAEMKNRYDVQTAIMLCDVDALAKEKNSSSKITKQSKWSMAGVSSTSTEEETILLEKLNRYDAEIEAAYRNTTMACTAYARCMEQNNSNELSCTNTANRWADASTKFNSLVVDVKEIALEIEYLRAEANAEATNRSKVVVNNNITTNCGGKKCPPKEYCPCCDDRGCKSDCPCRRSPHPSILAQAARQLRKSLQLDVVIAATNLTLGREL